MTELTLKTDQSMERLMKHFGVKNKAELISKAIAILKMASHVEEINKDRRETKTKIV